MASTSYTVVAGDTLSGIAEHFYGDLSLFTVLADANRLVNPNVITVGEILLIPDLSTHHSVVAGDTLSALARRYYGDESDFHLIAHATKIPNPDLIFPGQVLTIPDLSTTTTASITCSVAALVFTGTATPLTAALEPAGIDTGTVKFVDVTAGTPTDVGGTSVAAVNDSRASTTWEVPAALAGSRSIVAVYEPTDPVHPMARGVKYTAATSDPVLVELTELTMARTAAIAEPVNVMVNPPAGAQAIRVNGIPGSNQWLQFAAAGDHQVPIAVTVAGGSVLSGAVTIAIAPDPPGAAPRPLLTVRSSAATRRIVTFTIDNFANSQNTVYHWNFGDGSTAVTTGHSTVNDYTDALVRDDVVTTFDVAVTAVGSDNSASTGRQTIAVVNHYAIAKQAGFLAPRTELLGVTPTVFGLIDDIRFAVINTEDEALVFTNSQTEPLTTAPDDLRIPTPMAPFTLTVPPKSTGTAEFPVADFTFTRDDFGIAIHLTGHGAQSQTPVRASVYAQIRLPRGITEPIFDSTVVAALEQTRVLLNRPAITTITTEDVRGLLQNIAPGAGADITPPTMPLLKHDAIIAPALLSTPVPVTNAGTVASGPMLAPITPLTALKTLEAFQGFPVVDDIIVTPGLPCDPDNLPDNLPAGAVCQLTGEYQWQWVPGRVLNAKKGDILLVPGGAGKIGLLLKQIGQNYAHCGIMTKNHTEVRQSTGSEDYLVTRQTGGIGGAELDPNAVKYGWPGTMTSTVDDAFNGQHLTGPDGNSYFFRNFDAVPSVGSGGVVVPPLVVKPPAALDTAQIRQFLHNIADAATTINGHYRFYAYTNPAIGLDSTGNAPAAAGWAANTVPTVCSSLVWLAAKKAGMPLEGSDPEAQSAELEPSDIAAGAQVGPHTKDGLYLYTASQRRSAADWLYHSIKNDVLDQIGWLKNVVSDAADNIANQIVNTFASDWADGDSENSDEWRNTGDASAVSPDNLMLWDDPGDTNMGGFHGLYGHHEELFFQPSTWARVPVYRWAIVPTKGDLHGVVTGPQGPIQGVTVSLLGSGAADQTTDGNGAFTFAQIPEGRYTVTAAKLIDTWYWQGQAEVNISAGASTTTTIILNQPPRLHRQITITVNTTISNSNLLGTTVKNFTDTRIVLLSPDHPTEKVVIGNTNTVTGRIEFDLEQDVLNGPINQIWFPLVSVDWTADELDPDNSVTSTERGHGAVDEGQIFSWTGLTVAHDPVIGSDFSRFDFTISNEQAPS